jgi:hypothetical protein
LIHANPLGNELPLSCSEQSGRFSAAAVPGLDVASNAKEAEKTKEAREPREARQTEQALAAWHEPEETETSKEPEETQPAERPEASASLSNW